MPLSMPCLLALGPSWLGGDALHIIDTGPRAAVEQD